MRKVKFKVLANGLDFDTKLTDMQGKTLITIPAGCAGEFVESIKRPEFESLRYQQMAIFVRWQEKYWKVKKKK